MIRFGTGGWREIIGDGFTKENIRRVACAVARRMKREKVENEGFCIGYDRRFLSREAAIWFSEVMAGEGIHLDFVNLAAPTPQIMFTVKDRNLPYGAAITASHNPKEYNGLKMTYAKQTLNEKQIAEVKDFTFKNWTSFNRSTIQPFNSKIITEYNIIPDYT